MSGTVELNVEQKRLVVHESQRDVEFKLRQDKGDPDALYAHIPMRHAAIILDELLAWTYTEVDANGTGLHLWIEKGE